jgi:hypothetical protein
MLLTEGYVEEGDESAPSLATALLFLHFQIRTIPISQQIEDQRIEASVSYRNGSANQGMQLWNNVELSGSHLAPRRRPTDENTKA